MVTSKTGIGSSMTYEAIKDLLGYCTEQRCSVQITFDFEKDEFTADFKSQAHSEACFEELVANGHTVTFEPKPYYARVA